MEGGRLKNAIIECYQNLQLAGKKYWKGSRV